MEGFGKYHWKQRGHTYQGQWKQGKMEGGGEFTHADGNILKGTFQNNYFNDRNKRFLNPMHGLDEL